MKKTSPVNNQPDRTPVNRDAARIFRRDGVHEPEAVAGLRELEWDQCPPHERLRWNEVDQSGKRFGRLAVIGLYSRSSRTEKRYRWIVRCICGRFEVRRTNAIKRADPEECCRRCSDLRELRQGKQRKPQR